MMYHFAQRHTLQHDMKVTMLDTSESRPVNEVF